jgi:hypothetical protein
MESAGSLSTCHDIVPLVNSSHASSKHAYTIRHVANALWLPAESEINGADPAINETGVLVTVSLIG